jgi:mannose-6-phosphate isomerase-like protein (cupin superfamily)
MAESWTWPYELDAVRAAPKQHLVLMENERVRVLDTRVAPGETVPMHTHRWPATLYVVSWSDCVRRDRTGTVVMDSRVTKMNMEGQALWTPPLGPHTLENVGAKELRVIVVELKE